MLVQTRSQIYKQTRHKVVFGLVKFAFSQSQGDLKQGCLTFVLLELKLLQKVLKRVRDDQGV